MDSVFDLLFTGIASVVDILSNKFVFSFGGFSFSLWDFFIACALLGIIVPFLIATRSGSPLAVFRTSERNKDGDSDA